MRMLIWCGETRSNVAFQGRSPGFGRVIMWMHDPSATITSVQWPETHPKCLADDPNYQLLRNKELFPLKRRQDLRTTAHGAHDMTV